MVNKVKAVGRDRDSLAGAKTVAKAYLGKERECALAHASLYQTFLRDAAETSDMGRLSRRLEELSEARQSVVNKVKAAERDRDSLDGAKTVAEAYQGKERECAMAHASLYQIFLRDGQVSLNLHIRCFAIIMITLSLNFM